MLEGPYRTRLSGAGDGGAAWEDWNCIFFVRPGLLFCHQSIGEALKGTRRPLYLFPFRRK